MGPKRAGASRTVTKMAVGPSAPPMMPMALDSGPVKPMKRQPTKVMKMPSWAQQQGLGVGDEGTEVRHSAHAHEDQAGIDTQLDA